VCHDKISAFYVTLSFYAKSIKSIFLQQKPGVRHHPFITAISPGVEQNRKVLRKVMTDLYPIKRDPDWITHDIACCQLNIDETASETDQKQIVVHFLEGI
jgi:hypothetical protein